MQGELLVGMAKGKRKRNVGVNTLCAISARVLATLVSNPVSLDGMPGREWTKGPGWFKSRSIFAPLLLRCHQLQKIPSSRAEFVYVRSYRMRISKMKQIRPMGGLNTWGSAIGADFPWHRALWTTALRLPDSLDVSPNQQC
jgi:hypothetical protein